MQDSKLMTIRILDILREETDKDHSITQKEIGEKLYAKYGVEVDRKTIKEYLDAINNNLCELEFKRGEGVRLIDKEFEDSEIEYLIDAVICNRFIPESNTKELVNKILKMTSKYFKNNYTNIYTVGEQNKQQNNDLFYNIEVINDAINHKKKIAFEYHKYGADGKLHKGKDWIVNPYRLVFNNQRYYLMGSAEISGELKMTFMRVIYMKGIKETDEKRISETKIKGYEKGIKSNKISALPYMFAEAPVDVLLIAKGDMVIHEIIDWFGKEAKIFPQKDGETYSVHINVNEKAMQYWAQQYIEYVEIIEPKSLRDKMKKTIEDARKKYK